MPAMYRGRSSWRCLDTIPSTLVVGCCLSGHGLGSAVYLAVRSDDTAAVWFINVLVLKSVSGGCSVVYELV